MYTCIADVIACITVVIVFTMVLLTVRYGIRKVDAYHRDVAHMENERYRSVR
jgi:hypothetical protein